MMDFKAWLKLSEAGTSTACVAGFSRQVLPMVRRAVLGPWASPGDPFFDKKKSSVTFDDMDDDERESFGLPPKKRRNQRRKIDEMVVDQQSSNPDLLVADRKGRVHLINSKMQGKQALNFLVQNGFLGAGWELDELEDVYGTDIKSCLDGLSKQEPLLPYGRIDLHNKTVDLANAWLNPASSTVLRKISDALGGITYMRGGVPYQTAGSGASTHVYFHGTAEAYIGKIRRFGLVPGSNDGNWNVGNVPRPVSLAADRATARWHAEQTAEATNSRPVVLTVRIPDPSKIGYDYDVMNAIEPTDGGTPDEHRNMLRAGRETGLIAYSGRIPASCITHYDVGPWEEDAT